MKLTEESLKICCGEADPAYYKGFDDVHRVVLVPKKSKTRKSKSGSKKKASMKHKQADLFLFQDFQEWLEIVIL